DTLEKGPDRAERQVTRAFGAAAIGPRSTRRIEGDWPAFVGEPVRCPPCPPPRNRLCNPLEPRLEGPPAYRDSHRSGALPPGRKPRGTGWAKVTSISCCSR